MNITALHYVKERTDVSDMKCIHFQQYRKISNKSHLSM